MKILKVFPLLLVTAVCFSAANPPRVSRDSVVSGETGLENHLKGLWTDLTVIGRARGVYLEGYGVVFTAEVTVVTAPILMMGPPLTQQQKDQIKATKLQRLPEVKNALKQELAALAASVDVPPEENVVIALLLYRYPGEEKLPVQVIVQAPRKKLLDAKGTAALDQVIHVSEVY
jgi:hypothetical protein